jgi:peptidyl-prolyl cis-trans isomerase SurA
VHIVKRIAFAETPAEKDNAGLQFELKQKLMQDSRMNEARESFSRNVVSLIGYKKLAIVKDVDLFRYADSISNSTSQMDIDQFSISKKKVLMIKENVLKGADWLNFVKDYKTNPEQYNGESNTVLWNKFITYSAMEYYRQHLEDYNVDFRYQMKEFKEGNMLFEIMERNVWSKAASDTTGLLNQYNANKTKYKWAPSAEVLIFNCSNEKLANETIKAIMKGKQWKEISDSSEGSIQADSGRYEITQITDPSSHGEPAGNSYSSIIKNSDGTATFVKYIKIYPADQQRSFEEARGLVINDYQTVLEKKWLESLRKKYPVKINEAVVREMIH